MSGWKVRVVLEFDADRLTLEELDAMLGNFRRNLKPAPEDVYFELVREGRP